MEEGKQLFGVKEQTDQGETCFHWSEPIPEGAVKYSRDIFYHCSSPFGFHFVFVAEYHTCSVGRLYLAQWCARAGPAVTAVLSIVHSGLLVMVSIKDKPATNVLCLLFSGLVVL